MDLPTPPPAPAQPWRRLRVCALALGLVALGAAGWRWWPELVGASQACATWVAGQGMLGAAVFVLGYTAWTLALPKGPLIALAGLTYGFLPGLALVYLGSTCAIAASFLIARRCGRGRLAPWLASRPWTAALDQALADQGGRIVLLLRLSPVMPFQVQNYLYGLSRVPLPTCLAASWIGMLPFTALCLGAGTLADGSTHQALPWWALPTGLAATVAALTLITRAARQRLRTVGVVAA